MISLKPKQNMRLGKPYQKTSLLDADLELYLTSLTDSITRRQKTLLNKFVKTIKEGTGIGSLSDMFDFLYIVENDTRDAAIHNLAKRAHDITESGITVWGRYEGYIPSAYTYLDTNFNPATDGVNYKRDDASIGFYSSEEFIPTSLCDMGVEGTDGTRAFMYLRHSTNTFIARINDKVLPTYPAITTAKGMFIASRNSADKISLYHDGSHVGDVDVASSGIPDYNIYLGCVNNKGVAQSHSRKQYSLAFAGRGLTESEIQVIKNAFDEYRAADKYESYEYGDIIYAQDNFLVKHTDDKLYLSEDYGDTYTKQIDVSGIGIIMGLHVFENTKLCIATHTKCYYSHDWETLNESTVLDDAGNPFVPTDYDNFTFYLRSQKRGIVDSEEIFCWGNYAQAADTQFRNINIWYTKDYGVTVKSLYKFKHIDDIGVPGNLFTRHVHCVDFNPADESFWVTAGDGDAYGEDERHFIKLTYDIDTDIWTFSLIATGENFKGSNIIFVGDKVYWTWDIGKYNGGIVKCDYDKIANVSDHEHILRTPNDCMWVTCNEASEMLVKQTKWGGSAKARVFYYSPDWGNTWHGIIGKMPDEYDDDWDANYLNNFHVNDRGQEISGIREYVFSPELKDWTRKPSVDLIQFLRLSGFPDAFKP